MRKANGQRKAHSRGYKPLDRYEWFNTDDQDLIPIRVDQWDVINRTYKMYGYPKRDTIQPKYQNITNFGLEPENQYFIREKIPVKLKQLEKKIRNRTVKAKDTFIRREVDTINLFWDTLEKDRDLYESEIQWLRDQWHYRLFGKYYLINGKVTYITGAHWFYLNYWYLDTILPEYRDRDRRWFLSLQFSLTDTTTFANINEEGIPQPGEDGIYEMEDLGRRVCLGITIPKHRRAGDTSKAEVANTEYITRAVEAHFGIQGKDDDNAANVFTHHMVIPFKKLPIFWKPLFEQMDPRKEHHLNNENPELGLGSKVDFATSADRSAYDGYKLQRYHRDEPGKVKYEDINSAHDVVKECLSLGDGAEIIGFMMYTTTVDEMNNRGGLRFLKLVNESNYYQRNKNGQTKSGMYVFYFRASDGLEKYVGPYGESIEGDPTELQSEFIGRKNGAREHILNNRAPFIKAKDYEGLAERKRKFPLEFRECFIPPSKNVFFDMSIIEKRISDLQFRPETIRGDFHWEAGFGSRVYWKAEENGPFSISKVFKAGETNRVIERGGQKAPENPSVGILAVDPFSANREKTGGMSLGGISGFWGRDLQIDHDKVDVKDWVSHCYVLTYNFRRETTDLLCEDVLKAAIYTGYMVYPERNVDVISKKFIEWGYGGFLLYDTDPRTGRYKTDAGWYTQTSSKVAIFNWIRDYIKVHGHREKHIDFLQQCMDIRGMEYMTDFDVFTSCGGCGLGLSSQQGNYLLQQSAVVEVGGWLRKHKI